MQTVDVMLFDGTPDCSRRIQEWAEGRVAIWNEPRYGLVGCDCQGEEGRKYSHREDDYLMVKGPHGGMAAAGDLVVRDPRGGYRVAR